MRPEDIIAESFRIIEREVGPHRFSAEEWPIVRRMIHASGDLELAHAVVFRNGAVRQGLGALQRRAPIITDVNMVAAGINRAELERIGSTVRCFVNDPDIRQQATAQQRTRSYCAMQRALAEFPEGVYVIGNAPTALVAVCEAVRARKASPALLLAMPVGFVGVRESKQQALVLDIPVIAVQGRKGGSAVAAAAVNALTLLALETGKP